MRVEILNPSKLIRMQVIQKQLLKAGHLCSGGDLNPVSGFYFPLFSMEFPWGISIRVDTCGTGRKQKCGKLWSNYVQNLYVF